MRRPTRSRAGATRALSPLVRNMRVRQVIKTGAVQLALLSAAVPVLFPSLPLSPKTARAMRSHDNSSAHAAR